MKTKEKFFDSGFCQKRLLHLHDTYALKTEIACAGKK
jgi:hypothetical protein